MKKDHALEQGFTLIEIIIVLVLLGILAATAVPKYYDLVETANQKAAISAIAEVQARINLTFADELLAGKTCDKAVTTAKNIVKKEENLTIGNYVMTINAFKGANTTDDTTVVNSVFIDGQEITKPSTTSGSNTTSSWPVLRAPGCTVGTPATTQSE
ncbi:MAG: prepilin-type N-terminal cleavage/methylation domain-containing protein [Desulfovibrionaceae bacterium]|nr:prepilin-type N-terminal cleavage/methylation domain-containing protein [Desulfovibrionaceae bacterium]